MKEFELAMWWARVRASGPHKVAPSSAPVAGMRRLVEPDAESVWLVPVLPEGARPGVLEDLGLPELTSEQPNDTARVLAACVRCCWTESAGHLWPASAASYAQVASVFRQLAERDPTALHRALLAGIRRLAAGGWVLWDEENATVRLGPRVATWETADMTALRELWRLMPAPKAKDGESAPPPDADPDRADPDHADPGSDVDGGEP